MKTFAAILIAGVCASCASAPPELPSPANVRTTVYELPPEVLARAERSDPNDLDATALAGDHHFLMCGGEQVGACYQMVLAQDPDHIRANLGMGEWHVTNRRLEQSLPHLRKVLDLADKNSPEYAQARGVLKYVRYQLRRHPEAAVRDPS